MLGGCCACVWGGDGPEADVSVPRVFSATDGSDAGTGVSDSTAVAAPVATFWLDWEAAGVCWTLSLLDGGAVDEAGAARRAGALGANFLPDLSARNEHQDTAPKYLNP